MTPDEHEMAKRLFWERALLALLVDPRMKVERAAKLADEAIEEWKERFEK